MKKKTIWKRMLCLTLVGCSFMPNTIEAKTQEVNEKIETVYVIEDASGKIKEVIVSDWIKNNTSAKQIHDESILKDIVNVKGNEGFTQDENKLVWDAKGNDIYYEGVMNTSPILVKMTYTLDGKQVTPKEIQGKSGHITMHVEYVDDAKLQDKERIPMLMMSGMVLDTGIFNHVQIDHGKVINDGSRYIVAGYGVAGLPKTSDSVSSSFTIEADVKKFSTSEMITYASSNIFQELETSNDINMKTLLGQLNQLGDASKRLVDGSASLSEGINQLYLKTKDLSVGIEQLDDGARTIHQGLKSLSDGLSSAQIGSHQLSDALMQVSNGVDQLQAARIQVLNGMNQLEQGMDSASATLSTSIHYDEMVVQYLESLQVQNPQDSQLDQVIAAAKGSIQYQQAIQVSLMDKSQNDTLRHGLMQLQYGMGESENSIGAGLNALQMALKSTSTQQGTVGILEGMQILNQGITSAYEGSVALYDGSNSLKQGTSQLNGSKGMLISGVSQLDQGANDLKVGMSTFNETGIQKLLQVFNHDIASLLDELHDIISVGKQYQNVGGMNSNMKGSVRFIIKTEGIE